MRLILSRFRFYPLVITSTTYKSDGEMDIVPLIRSMGSTYG